MTNIDNNYMMYAINTLEKYMKKHIEYSQSFIVQGNLCSDDLKRFNKELSSNAEIVRLRKQRQEIRVFNEAWEKIFR